MRVCIGEFGREAPSSFWQIMTVGVGNYNLRRFDTAHGHFSDALDLATKRHGVDSVRVLPFKFHFANNLVELGHYKEARLVAEELISVFSSGPTEVESMALTAKPPLYMLGRSYGILGDAMAGLGDKELAEVALLKSHQILNDATTDAALEPYNVLLYRELTVHRLIRFYEAEGKVKEAARYRAQINSDVYVPI